MDTKEEQAIGRQLRQRYLETLALVHQVPSPHFSANFQCTDMAEASQHLHSRHLLIIASPELAFLCSPLCSCLAAAFLQHVP